MANVTISNNAPSFTWWPDVMSPNFFSEATVVTRGASAWKIVWPTSQGQVELTFTGTGLTYSSGAFPDGGRPITGTIAGMTVKVGGVTWLTATNLGAQAADIDHLLAGWPRGSGYQQGDSFNLWTFLLSGNDVITGSNGSDDLIAGRNPGNDTIYGGGGNDYIKADMGNDAIFGGDGRDTYSLSETFFDAYAFRGAVVNLATGSATDSWGGTDTLSSIESVEGSRMRDRITGSAQNDTFYGLKGADTLDGGDGYDMVGYNRDVDYGGRRGVTVNLATGTATDGWGNTDTLINIEAVRGTARGDRITGNDADNWLAGSDGIDTLDGGAGTDTANMYDDNSTQGVIVNLSLASGQVINDGFGNTETLLRFENVAGSIRNDSLTGNSAANELWGSWGNDTLIGGGGNDTLIGGSGADRLTGGAGADTFLFEAYDGAPWGDTITDFQRGIDKLSFDTGAFAGMDATLRFQNGTSAGGTGSWFYFNGATRQLLWDADGTGSGAAVVVATLTGVTALSASDFILT